LRKELDELESTLREKEKQMKYLLLHEGGERVDKESRV
jgi:hypothetical protein